MSGGMMGDTITLLCRFGPAKAQAFARFAIHGVSFTGGPGAKAGAPLETSLDRALLLIPLDACGAYLAPHAWETAEAAAREGHFTLRPGDVFVCGDATKDDMAPSAYLARHGGYKITSVTQKGGSGALAHFAVGAGRMYAQGGGVL